MIQPAFPDKCVTYKTFINDLATALVPKLMEAMENPSDLISQNRAFKMFGQGISVGGVRKVFSNPSASVRGR